MQKDECWTGARRGWVGGQQNNNVRISFHRYKLVYKNLLSFCTGLPACYCYMPTSKVFAVVIGIWHALLSLPGCVLFRFMLTVVTIESDRAAQLEVFRMGITFAVLKAVRTGPDVRELLTMEIMKGRRWSGIFWKVWVQWAGGSCMISFVESKEKCSGDRMERHLKDWQLSDNHLIKKKKKRV